MSEREALSDARPRVLVTGSRGWDAVDIVYRALNDLRDRLGRKLVILQGGAEGADRIAYWWAIDTEGVSPHTVKPDYKAHGARAPHVRNDEMLAQADFVIAFWDGKSRGTKSVIYKAIKLDLPWEVHSPPGVYVEILTDVPGAMAE